jgi:hypothetical protein
MGAGDDAALGGLAEHLSQPYDRRCAGRDHVDQNLPGSNGGKLINVTDNEQRGMVGDGPQESLHQTLASSPQNMAGAQFSGVWSRCAMVSTSG